MRGIPQRGATVDRFAGARNDDGRVKERPSPETG
ncbi:hypothetical protein QO012_002362 [Methylobacterium aerolatum]|uniref:Uncharacterized protein n=1 Tax=Methylobacterium aerolatum TaxID=418708 RepID=A0ABU0HZT6_9HYPH|nr:hypothetical protein [Methylobacterium aerolatum]